MTKEENKRKRQGPGLILALLGLAAILLLGRPPEDIPPEYTFAGEPVKVAEELLKGEDGDLPQRVLVPELGIDLEVNKARIIQGYWEIFSDRAGWGEGSGLPGKSGNQVIFAHTREGLFLPLKNIKEGMRIYVFTKDDWFSYEVKEIMEVLPNQVEVIAPTEDETLTLYTCSGFNDEKRLIVVAKRT